jgi:hypothetical protein
MTILLTSCLLMSKIGTRRNCDAGDEQEAVAETTACNDVGAEAVLKGLHNSAG